MPSARVETAELARPVRLRARAGPLLTALAAAGVLAFALLTTDEYNQHLVMWVGLNAVLAVGLRFVLLVGETNIATGAFYGIGAYVAAVCTVNFAVPFPLALLAGGVVATVVGSSRCAPRDLTSC
jgi:ABC-type branched-subunit amino acid transport system permease subunit